MPTCRSLIDICFDICFDDRFCDTFCEHACQAKVHLAFYQLRFYSISKVFSEKVVRQRTAVTTHFLKFRLSSEINYLYFLSKCQESLLFLSVTTSLSTFLPSHHIVYFLVAILDRFTVRYS